MDKNEKSLGEIVLIEYKTELTKDDAIFFMDMVASVWSPNFVSKLYKAKPYIKILTEKVSDNYKRFIGLYTAMSYLLSERELIILNGIYGVNKERARLKSVAKLLNLSPERVRQIRNEAEKKIAKKLWVKLKD
ncbi:hypothetical protein [Neobacillus sp. OS1-33]|uniref:hypothetical protein n=1 Tax=Neobacillus sp. OS1-33 TaxID=3070683 RepID=UPI0027E0D74B|nr:hypothetical protein [Neobacillus sp. OS1-33]WML26283.1 hypothetical protein RCG22_01155 [Neobacillus sp. OS1-33]